MPPRGRADTLGGSQTRTPPPRKIHPTPLLIASNHPHLSSVPGARPGRAHPRAHQPLLRTPEPPRSPLVPLHCPCGRYPQSRRRAHLFRGRLRAAPRARPQAGPCVLVAHLQGRPGCTTWKQVPPFPHFGEGRRGRVAGEREVPRPGRTPRVLAPAALRSALRAAADPSPPRLRGLRHLPCGAGGSWGRSRAPRFFLAWC